MGSMVMWGRYIMEIFLLLVAAILFACIGAYMEKNKVIESYFGWFLYGNFVGVVLTALLILGVVK